MSLREIRTASPDASAACDVCGRTLLRGERAHPYLQGTEHRTVCELCTARAVQEGWVREGAAPAYSGREARGERRGSLLGRLRNRREAPEDGVAEEEPAAPSRLRRPVELPRRRPTEPRHVRAVPTGIEQRMAAAVDAFNGSEHPRTVAGVARSLGAPGVAVLPDEQRPSQVGVTVWWELSWYRYEIDLGDGSVRVGSQGSELNELSEPELAPNARCDERGMLALDG